MDMNRWGSEGPPPEAYSRATNPERFLPLHTFALRLLEQLQAAFSVERFEGYGLDSELEVGHLARPTIRLIPRDQKAAPLAIAFTTFPGLRVRVGRWLIDRFPSCGCDACDETADGEATRLAELIDDVRCGTFREAISFSLAGDGWQESEHWSLGGHRHSSRSLLDRARAREMLAGRESWSIEWEPWPRRDTGKSPCNIV
jgi:Family of unknown function (DUF6226)